MVAVLSTINALFSLLSFSVQISDFSLSAVGLADSFARLNLRIVYSPAPCEDATSCDWGTYFLCILAQFRSFGDGQTTDHDPL